MTSKSFSSKGLLWDTMRRNLWALVLSGVGFFLSLLLPVMMQVQTTLANRADWLKNLSQAQVDQNWQISMDTLAELLGSGNVFVKCALVVMAVVSGVALFAYLHARQKVDFYHSLPISRTRLFANNFLTGICCTFSTYLIVYALTIACTCALGCGEAVRWNEIGGTLLCSVIMFLLLYALTVLTTVVCGNTIITLLLLAWVFFSPMLLGMLQIGLFEKFYETYTSNTGGLLETAMKLTPVVLYFVLHGTHYIGERVMGVPQPGEPAFGLLVGYLVAAVVVTALAVFLFRIRKSERAGTALAFEPAKLPIKVYMCLVIGATFGWLFGVMAGNFWFWPGLVIGTVLFHWIVEIIYAFDFRAIFAKPLHLLAILVVLFAGMLAMQFDVTGYDTWLPDREDITAVDINVVTTPQLTDPANIDAVYSLMELGVQEVQNGTNVTTDNESGYRTVHITCQLGNRTVTRRYRSIPDTDDVNALLAQIEQSEEYKRAKWPLFRFEEASTDPGRQSNLTISAHTATGNLSAEVSNVAQVTQIITTLREESLSRTENSKPVIRLSMYYLDSEGGYEYFGDAYVNEEDTETLALIEQFTGLVPAPFSMETDDIASIRIDYSISYGYDQSVIETVEVTDRADIEALLKNAIDDMYTDESAGIRVANRENYTIDIVALQPDGDAIWLTYTEEDWPYEIVDKYRPDGVSDSTPESGIASTAEAVS